MWKCASQYIHTRQFLRDERMMHAAKLHNKSNMKPGTSRFKICFTASYSCMLFAVKLTYDMLLICIVQTCLRLASAHIQSILKAHITYGHFRLHAMLICIKSYVPYIMHNLSRVNVELSLYVPTLSVVGEVFMYIT